MKSPFASLRPNSDQSTRVVAMFYESLLCVYPKPTPYIDHITLNKNQQIRAVTTYKRSVQSTIQDLHSEHRLTLKAKYSATPHSKYEPETTMKFFSFTATALLALAFAGVQAQVGDTCTADEAGMSSLPFRSSNTSHGTN